MTEPTAVDALLAQASFTPLHHDWRVVRERDLVARLRALPLHRDVRVLLVNATMGLQLYPSVVDFFVLLQRAQPRVRVTSASYFDYVHELGEGVRRKGLTVVPVATVTGWSVAEVNRFDVVIAVGPSDALSGFMSLPGLTARLVCLDLAFYHQLIESSDEAFLSIKDSARWTQWRADRKLTGPDTYVSSLRERVAAQTHPVVCYSCQPETKVRNDLDAYFALQRFAWRWFNYIPAGFSYGVYHQADRYLFDVALLGSDGRSYGALDPRSLQGLRFLFLGAPERVPEFARMQSTLDITVVPRVDEDTYARLLALCRCVVLPMVPNSSNVLLSVVDALTAGKPLVTSRRIGLARLEQQGAPIVFHDNPMDLAFKTRQIVSDEARQREISERSVAFAREHLDIYRVLETLLHEQILAEP